MSTQIPMDPPKLFCMPARPLVCGLALFGAVRSFIQFFFSSGIVVGLSHIAVLLLDLLLLFGAYKNDVFALKWSQRVTVSYCVRLFWEINFMLFRKLTNNNFSLPAWSSRFLVFSSTQSFSPATWRLVYPEISQVLTQQKSKLSQM